MITVCPGWRREGYEGTEIDGVISVLSLLVAHSDARVAGGAPPANAPLDVIDRQDLTTRERDFLQLVGSLGAPLSDARALELFHSRSPT